MPLMTVTDLEKSYAGKMALQDVNMTVKPGEIVGLLGPNGSGKTTLLKVIAGLLTPDSGEITYPNGKSRGIESKAAVSFLPDRMDLPGWMRVRDAFAFWRDMYPDYSPGKAKIMSDLLELSQDARLSKMSLGMRERVLLALTFSREASVFLLDEPLGGIDPVGKMKVLESILSTQLEQNSILISTHLVKDVETIFDSVYFISGGRIVYDGSCEDIREGSGKTVEQVYLEVFSGVKTV